MFQGFFVFDSAFFHLRTVFACLGYGGLPTLDPPQTSQKYARHFYF
jgi:hypothetical protein